MSRLVGDRYPNYFSDTLTLSSANTFTTEEFSLPIVRPTTGTTRVTIIEVLWIDVYPDDIDLIAVDDALIFGFTTGGTPTASTGVISNGNTFARMEVLMQGSIAAGGGLDTLKFPIRMDLTDKNGFGQLIAVDKINVYANSVGQAAAVTFRWRMYYRYVTVGTMEYLGIVQSTTG